MMNSASTSAEGPITAKELKERQFAPVKFIVEGLMPTGLTILAGAPKAKKSWLALDIASSVSRGEPCLDQRRNLCSKGAVLYLALEDSQSRIRGRLAHLLGDDADWPGNLFFETDFPRIDADCLSRLRRWTDETPDARLIIIDVFHKIRSSTGSQGGYGKDYADLSELQKLAREKDIGIMLVHHLRKSGGDPFDRMMGSIGIQGAADTLVVLDDRGSGARLLARGRDIEETAQELIFDELSMRWRPSHRPAPVKNPERERVIAILRDSPKPMSALQISIITGQSANAVSQLLGTMMAEGKVCKAGWGTYVCSSSSKPSEAALPVQGQHDEQIGQNGQSGQNDQVVGSNGRVVDSASIRKQRDPNAFKRMREQLLRASKPPGFQSLPR